jgi:hypothetical protein
MEGGELIADFCAALCVELEPKRFAVVSAPAKGRPPYHVAFAHERALQRTYARLSSRGKTTIPEDGATVDDLGAMVGLALCFPSVAFTLHLSRRTVADVRAELDALALEQRAIGAAPNIYRTSLNCLRDALGLPTSLLQQTWDEHEAVGVFPPKNLALVEVRTERSRFKAGDLVREKYDRRVAIVQQVVDNGACHLEFGYFHACALEPYTLPPVTSYADLANVLDELPLGTIVEVTSARGVARFRRDSPKLYRCQHLSEDAATWMHATALTCLREKLLPMPAGIRLLPPGSL